MKKAGGLPHSAGFGMLESEEESGEEEAPAQDNKEAAKVFTLEEVKTHNSVGDVWIIVNNKVYDCTEYLESHPGGVESITIYGGRDCSDDFAAVHSGGATKLLEQYCIGVIYEADAVNKPANRAGASEEEVDEELDDNDPVLMAASRGLDKLGQVYGVSAGAMNPAHAAIVTRGWKMALCNEASFAHALVARWRLLVAVEHQLLQENEAKKGMTRGITGEDLNEVEYALRTSGIQSDAMKTYMVAFRSAQINRKALSIMIENEDPIASILGPMLGLVPDLVIGLIDAAVNDLGILSKSRHDQGEIERMGLIDGSFESFIRMFTRSGMQPVSSCSGWLILLYLLHIMIYIVT